MTGADFTGAKLDGSFLLEANLRGAHFRGADVKGAVVLSTQFDSASEKPMNIPSEPPGPKVTGVLHAHPEGLVGKHAPAEPGEFLELYCEGLGNLQWPDKAETIQQPRTVKVPRVMIGGEEAVVIYAGIAPANRAGYQVNFQFPKLPPGKHSLKLVVEGRSSEGFEIESGSPH